MALARSLSGKLILAVTVLVITCCLGMLTLMTVAYRQQLIQVAQEEGVRLAHQLALESADMVLLNDVVALQKMVDYNLSVHPALSYAFIQKGGQVQAHSFKDGFPTDLLTANDLGTDGSQRMVYVKTSAGERFFDVAWPILEGQGGVLRLGISETPYHLHVKALIQPIAFVVIGILLVGVLVARYIVGRLTHPLSRLVDAAERVGEGRLDIEVTVSSDEEVRRLVTAFNDMVRRVRDYTQRLERQHDEVSRAHLQTRESFRILQQIGSQKSLQDVCRYLIERFAEVVTCRRMAVLSLLEPVKELQVISSSDGVRTNGEIYDSVREAISGLDGISHLKREFLPAAVIPEPFEQAKRLVLVPITHEEHLLGAFIIGCENACACDHEGLAVIQMVIRQTAGSIQRAVSQEAELRQLHHRLEKNAGFNGIIGKDARMREIFKLVEDTAPTEANVLIQGESGTGKELVAWAVHQQSGRRQGPFVVINCSAFPATLLESELFGHEKGAFTGAHRRMTGRFEQAHGGSVFLDEIGEISLSAQVKLLRVLQNRTFERVGGESTVTVDVRIIAATNTDLLAAVQEGRFREDLYYRLNVIPIHLPPLKARKNDIPLLARHFLTVFAREQDKPVNDISSEAMRLLMAYQWPGNVRELENTIEHSVVLAKGWKVEVRDLPAELQATLEAKAAPPAVPGAPTPIAAGERSLIEDALNRAGWNKKLAARRLGISRSTLYNKIKKYQLTEKPTIH